MASVTSDVNLTWYLEWKYTLAWLQHNFGEPVKLSFSDVDEAKQSALAQSFASLNTLFPLQDRGDEVSTHLTILLACCLFDARSVLEKSVQAEALGILSTMTAKLGPGSDYPSLLTVMLCFMPCAKEWAARVSVNMALCTNSDTDKYGPIALSACTRALAIMNADNLPCLHTVYLASLIHPESATRSAMAVFLYGLTDPLSYCTLPFVDSSCSTQSQETGASSPCFQLPPSPNMSCSSLLDGLHLSSDLFELDSPFAESDPVSKLRRRPIRASSSRAMSISRSSLSVTGKSTRSDMEDLRIDLTQMPCLEPLYPEKGKIRGYDAENVSQRRYTDVCALCKRLVHEVVMNRLFQSTTEVIRDANKELVTQCRRSVTLWKVAARLRHLILIFDQWISQVVVSTSVLGHAVDVSSRGHEQPESRPITLADYAHGLSGNIISVTPDGVVVAYTLAAILRIANTTKNVTMTRNQRSKVTSRVTSACPTPSAAFAF